MEYGNRILPYLRIFLSYLRTKIILPEIEFTFESTKVVHPYVASYDSTFAKVRKYFRHYVYTCTEEYLRRYVFGIV